MNEMEQFCEIDGHDWSEQSCYVLSRNYPRMERLEKYCKVCGLEDVKIFREK